MTAGGLLFEPVTRRAAALLSALLVSALGCTGSQGSQGSQVTSAPPLTGVADASKPTRSFGLRNRQIDRPPLGLDSSVERRTGAIPGWAEGVVDGTWYYGDRSQVRAVDEASGSTLWTLTPDTPPGVAADERWYFDIMDGVITLEWTVDYGTIVQRVDPATGDLQWTIGGPDEHYSGIFADVAIFTTFGDEKIARAYDTTTGDLRWELPGWYLPTFAGADAVLMEQTETPGRTIGAIDLTNGAVLWTADTITSATVAEQIAMSFANNIFVADGTAYVTYGQWLQAYDLASGALRWSTELTIDEVDQIVPVDEALMVVGQGETSAFGGRPVLMRTVTPQGEVITGWLGHGSVIAELRIGGTGYIVEQDADALTVVDDHGDKTTRVDPSVVDRKVLGDTVLELYPGGVRAVAIPSLIERWHVDLPELDDPDSLEATESAFSVFSEATGTSILYAAGS